MMKLRILIDKLQKQYHEASKNAVKDTNHASQLRYQVIAETTKEHLHDVKALNAFMCKFW